MTTLYHSPNSRSSSLVALVEELGAAVDIKEVTITRNDGSGGPDPLNPHPEKKVPYLVDGNEKIRERGAIVLYLTDKFPEAGLGPIEGQPGRGEYLSWLFYYQGIMEPVGVFHFTGLTHPALTATFRDFDTMVQRLAEALEDQPYLLGDRYSAADLLCSSPFNWAPDLMPDNQAIRDWVARCSDRPAVRRIMEQDKRAA
ncbi:glutathione S-transferase family protein [Labrenzia sp. VG12]|uniref:glutathione S-transferase family protein n=1 Tax=Labrenzia sp. VG12 TaxID=2021862 RepID=UPI000B8C0E60|nr:glutathione S-transferase family protein [Labrenzia sp. VG12]ASP36541.1 glutathione S-transferase [Labrenzia sp. VG12]